MGVEFNFGKILGLGLPLWQFNSGSFSWCVMKRPKHWQSNYLGEETDALIWGCERSGSSHSFYAIINYRGLNSLHSCNWGVPESTSTPLVDFGVSNDNLIK
jgi:hypothetical protein